MNVIFRIIQILTALVLTFFGVGMFNDSVSFNTQVPIDNTSRVFSFLKQEDRLIDWHRELASAQEKDLHQETKSETLIRDFSVNESESSVIYFMNLPREVIKITRGLSREGEQLYLTSYYEITGDGLFWKSWNWFRLSFIKEHYVQQDQRLASRLSS